MRTLKWTEKAYWRRSRECTILENWNGQADGRWELGDLWKWGSSRGNRAVLQWTDTPVVIGASLTDSWEEDHWKCRK